MYKKKVLFVTEFSRLNTGYAVYSHEILKRLHASGKYRVAELACYCDSNNPLINDVPWKVYPNLPDINNEQERIAYESNPHAEFGEWKFEHVCLDFKPDVVMSIRDFWMDAFIDMSPFRRFYKTVMMPTVDASPQHPDWIDLYISTDAVLAYNDWSLEILRKEGGGLINLKDAAPPSADQEQFKFIIDKKAHKSKFGMRPETFIIGMVSRNQRRKLFPDLADAFLKLYDSLNDAQKKNTYMYWHTAYPDLGWEIPYYIKNRGLGSKILFSYICSNCRYFMPSFYRDVRAVCPRCNTGNLQFPNTNVGLSREDLGAINGLFDLYVQYATNEGFGIGQVEAAFCGTPVLATDYSAMEDVVRKLGGFPVQCNLFYECETGRRMALPNNADFAEKVKQYMSLPESLKNKRRYETYENAKRHYGSWDNVATVWMNAIDELEVEPQGWLSPPLLIPPLDKIPDPREMPDEKFTTWIIMNSLGNIRLVNKYVGLKLYRDLLWGRTNEAKSGGIYNELSHIGYRPKYAPMDRNKVAGLLNQLREKNNFWESARANGLRNN